MKNIYEELDEAKAEIEKLKVELRAKTDSLVNLNKTHDAQAEKVEQELLQKADEINYAKQINEDLKRNLNNKDSVIEHLTAANDKLGADCDEKFKMWEDEKRGLVLALEEANEKLKNQENKYLEIEKNLKVSKELGETDGMFQKLEEENLNVEEELKLKKDQFKHLEEEYEKLRIQFKASKEEWELEKSTLLDEISSLQSKLDSHMRLSMEKRFKEVYERSDEMEFELFTWNSFVKELKNDLESNLVMRKELENSLLAEVDFSESLKQEKDSLVHKLEEKENNRDFLEQHVFLSEQDPNIRDPARYLQIIEEKDKILENFQKEILRLEEESVRRELENDVNPKSYVQGTSEFEKENHINGKNKTDELMQQVISLEQKFTGSLTSFSSLLAEKQAEIDEVQEACDMITAIEVLASLEIEEKKLMIEELEENIHEMEQKLKFQEEKWSKSEQLALDIEEEMDAKQLKIKELTDQMENKLRGSEFFLQKLKIEKGSLLENGTRLLSERENLCTSEEIDTQVLEMLRSIVQSFENGCIGMNFRQDDGMIVKENMIMHSPTGIKKSETFSDIRSPFKELNN